MKIPFLVLAALITVVTACSEGAQTKAVTIHGTIRIKNLENSFYVVLASSQPENKAGGGKREYLIKGPLKEELGGNFRGKSVTLEGSLCTSPLPQFTDCMKPAKIMID